MRMILLVLALLAVKINAHAATLGCHSSDAAAPSLGFTAAIEDEKITRIDLDNGRVLGPMQLTKDSSFSMSKRALSLSATEICDFDGGSCLRIKMSASKEKDSSNYSGKLKIFLRDSFFHLRSGKIAVNVNCTVRE